MSIQFIQEMLNDVARELSEMVYHGYDRVRVLELGIIRMYLINKQDELHTEKDGEES
tara:strand:+ start:3951 stop:4121 length:171 start_codon:yes stop_codon:yes gene_type:complete